MSDVQLLLVAGAAAVVLAAAALLLRSRRGEGPMVEQARPMPRMRGSGDAAEPHTIGVALGRELLPLLEQGKFEEAAAVVTGRTGWTHEESLAAVRRLELLMKRLGME